MQYYTVLAKKLKNMAKHTLKEALDMEVHHIHQQSSVFVHVSVLVESKSLFFFFFKCLEMRSSYNKLQNLS